MTTAQPGQEQRMERDDLKVARVRRMAQRMGAIASNDEQRGFVDALNHVLALTRPTADLGEEMVERIAQTICAVQLGDGEAIDDEVLPGTPRWVGHLDEAKAVRALLSRSGDD